MHAAAKQDTTRVLNFYNMCAPIRAAPFFSPFSLFALCYSFFRHGGPQSLNPEHTEEKGEIRRPVTGTGIPFPKD
jgi:hypothetical protein